MQFTNKAYLLIGGNVGNVLLHLQHAVSLVNEQCGKVTNKSAVYETAPWGNTNQPSFLNQALELHTALQPAILLQKLLAIEETMGRKRTVKYGPRIIDIDILLYGNEVCNTPDLIIPHPELPNRLFALVPLAEIAADVTHPLIQKTIRELLQDSKDELPVKKLS